MLNDLLLWLLLIVHQIQEDQDKKKETCIINTVSVLKPAEKSNFL